MSAILIWLGRGLAVALPTFCMLACSTVRTEDTTELRRARAAAASQGLKLGGTNGVYVERIGPLTYSRSLSAVYSKGDRRATTPPIQREFGLSRSGALRLRVGVWSPTCQIEPEQEEKLENSIKDVFDLLANVSPAGTISVYLIEPGRGVTQRTDTWRIGPSIRLDFYFPCSREQPDVDIFAALLEASHEATHAIFLFNGINRSTAEDERLADGAPACIYDRLVALRTEHLLRAFPYQHYFAGMPFRFGLHDSDADRICADWKSAAQAITTHAFPRS